MHTRTFHPFFPTSIGIFSNFTESFISQVVQIVILNPLKLPPESM